MENVKLNKGFAQVYMLTGCKMSEDGKPSNDTIIEFEKWFFDELNCRVQFLEEIITGPDSNDMIDVIPGTGGTHDILAAIHNDDIVKLTIWKINKIKNHQNAPRWIEDVLAKCNYKSRIYPERLFDYCCWNEENLAREVI